MTPGAEGEILAEVRALREDVGEVKKLAEATNGRVRRLEIWQARIEGMGSSGKGALAYFIAPVVTGVVVAAVVGFLTH